MQVMTVLPQEDLRGIEQSTQAAELAGYDQISSMENRYDPLLPLGIAAVASASASANLRLGEVVVEVAQLAASPRKAIFVFTTLYCAALPDRRPPTS